MKNSGWLSRRLGDGPHLMLCTRQEDYQRICRKEMLKELNLIGDATAMLYEKGYKDQPTAIVCVQPNLEKRLPPIQIATLLVHEAVHVFQFHCKCIHEDAPGDEIEAYGIQAIAQRLMYEYAIQKGWNPPFYV